MVGDRVRLLDADAEGLSAGCRLQRLLPPADDADDADDDDIR